MPTRKGAAVGRSWWAALIVCACGSSTEPGVRVEFISQQSLAAGQELGAATGVVRVEEMRWTASEVELYPCASVADSIRGWIIADAHAHGISSPTRMAVPVVVDATVAEGVALGELLPPAGSYCSVRYRVAPADGDAVGLSAAPNMRGRSFLLRGAFGRASGELQDFELTSQLAFEMTRDIGLDLTSDHRSAGLRFGCDPERWFLGLDLGSLAGEGRAAAILAAFRSSFNVIVE